LSGITILFFPNLSKYPYFSLDVSIPYHKSGKLKNYTRNSRLNYAKIHKNIHFSGNKRFFVLVIIIIIWASNISIPDFQSFEKQKNCPSTKIYDNTGEILLYDIHQNISRTVINFNDITRQVKNATVAIEDSGFYQHHE